MDFWFGLHLEILLAFLEVMRVIFLPKEFRYCFYISLIVQPKSSERERIKKLV